MSSRTFYDNNRSSALLHATLLCLLQRILHWQINNTQLPIPDHEGDMEYEQTHHLDHRAEGQEDSMKLEHNEIGLKA